MKAVIPFVILMTFSLKTFADCLPHYEEKMAKIDAWRGPTLGATVNGSIGTVAGQTAMMALGTFNPAGAITAGAVVLASGAVYGYTSLRKHVYNIAYLAIKGAYEGKGKYFVKLHKSIEKKLDKDIEKYVLENILKEVNETEEACITENERYKPLTFKGLKSLVVGKLN